MKKVISTPNAPAAIGPYSQAIAFGDMLITSGQLGLDPKSVLSYQKMSQHRRSKSFAI